MSGTRASPPAPWPPRAADCLSDLRIDAWLARDLSPADEQAVRAHLSGCAHCAARAAGIQATRDRAAPGAAAGWEAIRRAAAGQAAPGVRSVAGRRWWAPSLLVAGAATAALALYAYPRARSGGGSAGDEAGERGKGGARLGFFVKHGEHIRRGGPSEIVNPGDVVRFTVSARAPTHVALLAVDATRTATVFFPAGGRDDAPVPAGQDVELPRATQLDDTPGTETIHALFCPGPIDLEPVRRALQAQPDRLAVPPGCSTDQVTWTKARAP